MKQETDQERKAVWEIGGCPYCGSGHVKSRSIEKNIRGYKKPARGIEYECEICECKNQFTTGGF